MFTQFTRYRPEPCQYPQNSNEVGTHWPTTKRKKTRDDNVRVKVETASQSGTFSRYVLRSVIRSIDQR